jgi:hypothetical protein
MKETSTTAPLGCNARDPGAPTINAKNVNRGPPLGGDEGDPGALTMNTKTIDGGPLGR